MQIFFPIESLLFVNSRRQNVSYFANISVDYTIVGYVCSFTSPAVIDFYITKYKTK